MSDIHTDDAAETAPRQASPGEMLHREREVQGLDREEVAAALNLRPAVIRSLEEDSYEEVPIATYRRGYLRAYANLLGIDDTPVLEAYRTLYGSDDAIQRKVTPVQVTRPPSRLGVWLFRLMTLLVLAGLIGLTLMWWQSRGGNEPPGIGDSDPVAVDRLDGSSVVTDSANPPPEAEPESLPPLPEEDIEAITGTEAIATETPQDDAGPDPAPTEEVDTGLAETAVDEDAAEVGAAEEIATEQSATEESAPEEPTAPEPDPRLLELTFNEQSWTEIFDANNQRIFVGLQEPGTTASVEGEPPFRMTVGNATGVELVWQGEPVDLEARAGANNVARFTLGE
ncbi:RodZ domain-containing protein [Halomonas daqiaonensis]|uniref:Cytoskeleton protein RodZ n=1 Tax=Halomonas daqiaonensis TaxID=650850 RepID=A0A1H7R160_9GAMM|nr:RodZ domain-containing protein [Halomonas daqiaonensis]SEL53664.1 cytoskeleton protein RodZ [Halomonas daqiaonensis]